MSGAVIIGIVAVALLVIDHVLTSVMFRRALKDALLIVEQTMMFGDRTQERAAIQQHDLLDRIMATDFAAYKEQKDVELSEGYFEPPEDENKLEEEGGVIRPGQFPRTPRADDLEDTQILAEAAILEEDFDEAGNPRR